MSDTLKPGYYRHYKGQNYYVFGTARHSETEELMVVYRTDYGDKSHWVRPYDMFVETITIDEKETPRFQWIGLAPIE